MWVPGVMHFLDFQIHLKSDLVFGTNSYFFLLGFIPKIKLLFFLHFILRFLALSVRNSFQYLSPVIDWAIASNY